MVTSLFAYLVFALEKNACPFDTSNRTSSTDQPEVERASQGFCSGTIYDNCQNI
ncbi:hypothetical protein M107_0675 [Bacteroides fragilis str. 3725 D9(v)]|nr:hypothetical protein M107_0675 [Bacteroides fragilis str. 3725 D9(v)]